MNFALIGGVVLAVLVVAMFLLLLRRAASQGKNADADLEWSNDFSMAKYRPMERLFLDEDYDFLAAQPGFHSRIYKKLLVERRRVFRHYLRCLRRDFDRLSGAAKVLLLSAAQDRPDLATSLVKQRLIFAYAMRMVEARLLLQTLGIGTVDVRPLVEVVEGMRDQLRHLSQHVQVAEI